MPDTFQSSLPSDEVFRIKPIKGEKKKEATVGGEPGVSSTAE